MSRWIAVSMVALGLMIAAPDSLALGIGPYLTLESGSVKWDDPNGPVFDGDTTERGVGVVIDTNTATPRLFAYRFQFAVQQMDSSDAENLFELTGFRVTNTFAFKIHAREKVRYWWGPQVRVGYFSGDYYFRGSRFNTDLFDLAPGIVIGANLHTSPTISVTFELGYRHSWFDGDVSNLDATGSGGQAFFQFTLLHRRGNDWFGGF